ncbi:hypothetical protein C0J52_14999 [Blattella germanica]|nr:hypothetical protein C0J52_14999 [Blattella germanica]
MWHSWQLTICNARLSKSAGVLILHIVRVKLNLMRPFLLFYTVNFFILFDFIISLKSGCILLETHMSKAIIQVIVSGYCCFVLSFYKFHNRKCLLTEILYVLPNITIFFFFAMFSFRFWNCESGRDFIKFD